MSRTDFILDASALLCLLYEEPGAERVEAVIDRSSMSAVNHAEVVAADLRELGIDVIPFERGQAEASGALRTASRTFGLSLGDRARLALAAHSDAIALTTDRIWTKLDIGIRVEVVR